MSTIFKWPFILGILVDYLEHNTLERPWLSISNYASHAKYVVRKPISRKLNLLTRSDGQMACHHIHQEMVPVIRGTRGSIKSGLIRVLLFNRELRISHRSLLKTPIWIAYQYLTAMASRRSLFKLTEWPSCRSIFDSHHQVFYHPADRNLRI